MQRSNLARRFVSGVIPLALYVAAALALFCRDMGSGSIFQPGIDPIVYVWCLNWWPYAILHHLDPSVSTFIWHPTGFPMWWANSIPTLAAILAPITLTLGPVASWNVIMTMTPAINAYAAFLLLRYLTKSAAASFIGGLLFGFSSYVVAAQLGHVSLSLVPFVPLSTLLVIKRAREEVSRTRFIAALAILAVLQFGISTEVLATSAFFGLITFAVFYRRYRELDFLGVAIDALIAGVIAVLVLSPALYHMVIGAKELPTVINPPKMFSTDVLNLLIPNPTTWLGSETFSAVSSKFTGNFSEQGAYIGIGLFVIGLFSIHKNLSERWARPLLTMLVLAFVFSLGPYLWLGGHMIHIPLPWIIFTKVPVIRHALPSRFTLYMWLALSIFVAAWLAQSEGDRRAMVRRYTLAAAAFLFLLPNPAWFKFGDVPVPKLFERGTAEKILGANANVVVLPFGYLGNSLFWQLQSGMEFKMAGGYVGFAPQSMWKHKAMMYFYDAEQAPTQEAFNSAAADFCAANKVTAITIAPGTSKTLMAALLALPWDKETYGDVTIIRVPPGLK